MRRFQILAATFALVISASTAFAVEDTAKYEAYRSRLAARHAAALAARRDLAKLQGRHVYAIPSTQTSHYPITPLNAIQQGIVTYPAIPRPSQSFGFESLAYPTRRFNAYRGIALSVGRRR